MRAKFDFVTNSSSTAYILAMTSNVMPFLNRVIEKLIELNPETNEGIGIGEEFDDLELLQNYVNGGPYDWVSKCRGLQYDYMSKANYDTCKAAVEDGATIVIVYVDHDLTEDFESAISGEIDIIDSDG